MRHRYLTPTIIILLLSALLVAACGGNRNSGTNNEDEVQSGIATGIAATQVAQRATSEAEAAIAQAVEATLTAQAAETPKDEAIEATQTPTPAAVVAGSTAAVTPTDTSTDEPTPTPPALVVIPFEFATVEAAPTPPALIILPGGGSGDGMEGIIVTQPELFFIDDDPDTPVFSRELSLQMLVRILDEGSEDGAGIDSVEIEVVNDEGNTVYAKIEQTAGYCLFGGGEPACSVVTLNPGEKWPGTDRPIEDRGYTAYFTVVPEDSSIEYGEWQQNFEVRRSAYSNGASAGGAARADIRAELVESEGGGTNRTITESLVYQVAVADYARGKRDGDGIDHVVMGVIGPGGSQAYAKRENDAAYCAFGGDAPCRAWDFSENGYRWPDDQPIEKGTHILRAIVVTESGDSQVFDWEIEIQ